MMKKFILSCAAAAFAGISTLADDADLRSIDAVSDSTFTYPNDTNPLNAGQSFYILVRLLNQDYGATLAGGTPHPWQFKSTSTGSASLDATVYTPKLALSIGGKRAYAIYSDVGPNGELSGLNRETDANGKYGYYTDLYFKHTVEAGELGLPVKLLGKDSQVGDGTSEVLMVNVNTGTDSYNAWDLTNDSDSPRLAVLKFVSSGSLPGNVLYPKKPDTTPHTDASLAAEGVYVQTVKFDTTCDDEANGVWRDVYPGLSSAVLNTPRLTGTGPATVYVWSEDETVFVPVGDNTITVDGKTVLPVTIGSGESSASFRMRGGSAAEGTTCKIYMSPSTSKEFNDIGDVIENSAVSQTVRMHAAPSPTVTFRLNGEDDRATVTCPTTNYYDHVAQLTVNLTPAVEHDVWVELTASLKDTGDLSDIYDATLLGISENDGGDAYEDRTTKVKIPSGTSTVQLYLYSLGWTARTGSSKTGIVFKPGKVCTDENLAAEDAEVKASTAGCTLFVNRVNPTILSIDPGYPTGTATAVGGVPTTFRVTLADCYRNIMDENNGYTFKWTSTDGEELTDSEGITEEDDYFTLDQTFVQAGTKTISLRAIAPFNSASSETVSFELEVGKAKQITATLPGNQPWRIAEGTTLPVTFALEGGTANATTYAFLEPIDEASSNAVDLTVAPFKTGVAIPKGTYDASFQPDISFVDGTRSCEFTVKLSSKQEEYKKQAGFEDGTLYVVVTNVEPVVTAVTAGGMPVENGDTARSVPKGVNTGFQLSATDVAADLNAVDADGNGTFLTKWVIYDGTATTIVTNGNPNGVTVTHMFRNDTVGAEGALVQVFLKDKDMADYPSTANWSFRVPVAKTPRVTLAYEDDADTGIWYENDKTGHGIRVGLSQAATADIQVRVKVPKAADGGYVKFRTRTNSVWEDTENEDCYIVRFPVGTTSVALTAIEMDGTSDSSAGIDLEAFVITTDDSGYGKPWNEYYEEASALAPLLRVVNVAPEGVTTPSDGTTNTTAKVYTDYTVKYKVSNDVTADLAGGITVTLEVDGDEIDTATVMDKTQHTFETPVTFTSPGLKTVKVTFTDKDENSSVSTLYYNVMETKTVVVSAHDPASSRSSSNQHSVRYGNKAKGLGAGRVDGESVNPQKVASWVSTFSLAVTDSSFPVIATGYQVANPVNDQISSLGQYPRTTGDEAYSYLNDSRGAKGYDSFFYAWVCNNSTTFDGLDLETDIMIGPAKANTFAIPLQPYDAQKSTYDTQYWEAVFSREWLSSDNCGDINADGIPDIIVTAYPGFGIFDANLTKSGDDLEDISDWNDDADYFPNTDTSSIASFIPGLSNTWVTAGTPFEARFEIRGWYANGGEASPALNDAAQQLGFDRNFTSVVKFTDPATDSESTLSPIEWWAFTNYCAKIERTPDDTTIWAGGSDTLAWSPERPTDPTLADTDKDGFPDGYEYYVWYRAHVGYTENGEYKKLTGRRYNPKDPMHPEIITSEEIASLYDPRHDLSGAASPGPTTDTDNDGLTDLVELALGTNPFDFDTDGDGLPDGYELAISKTDPLKAVTGESTSEPDGQANPDGDAMAFYTVQLPMLGFAEEGTEEVSEYWFGDGAWSLFSTDATGADPKVCYFVNGADGTRYLVTEGIVEYKKDDEAKTVTVTAAINAYSSWATGTVDKTTFYYPGDAAATVDLNGMQLDYTNPTELGSGNIYKAWDYDSEGTRIAGVACGADDLKDLLNRTVALSATTNLTFIHFQVYQKLGYNPLTATHWKLPDSWAAVNTKAFTNYDEYMLMTFLYRQGVIADADLVQTTSEPMTTIWQKFTTNPLKADSFGHDIPDGWELYTLYAPGDAPKGLASEGRTISSLAAACPVVSDVDPDKDGLSFAEEFAGYLSTGLYPASDYCTIPELNEKQTKWRNKLWATDPWNEDSDGDGINDGAEYAEVFIYGDSGVAGGGLNPLSWDTDGDGLPDPWELEFAGTHSESTTTTDSTNATTTASTVWNNDGMDGTVNDAMLDYDNDGLLNWQEYMVGAMRCWRYDDTVSGWSSHTFDWESIPTDESSEEWGKFWYGVLVDEQNTEGLFNPHLVVGTFDGGSYFSLCTNAWDQSANGKYYMFRDGVYHDLKTPPAGKYMVGDVQYNRFSYKAATAADWSQPHAFILLKGLYPAKYITCDPRMADTDGDGMDDYYEVFHGMNPLLGLEGVSGKGTSRDIVFEAYDASQPVSGVAWHALENYWYPSDEEAANGLHRPVRFKTSSDPTIGGGVAWDFEAFPWLTGLAAADPDGDNIRNAEEAIMPQLQASSNYLHTDPTPLWMTDTSYPESFTRRFYRPPSGIVGFSSSTGTFTYDGQVYRFDSIPGFQWDEKNGIVSFNRNFDSYTINNWNVTSGYFFSFEENEGYDSDHDFLDDYEEGRGRTKSASDALDSDDPLRRQAMWFGGDDDKSFLQSHVFTEEDVPVVAANAEYRENFLYYTVECWAKPDGSILGSNGLRTLVERAIWTSPSGPADAKYLRKNFLIGIKNGKWYTKYDSAGTDKLQPVEITEGPAATTNWTHVAATYDGKKLTLYVNGETSADMSKSSKDQPEHGIASRTAIASDYYTKYTAISYLVGASALDMYAVYFDLGQRVPDSENPTFDDYGNYYKGYIDEVRIWDGARSAADIAADVKNRTRYTAALASANRQAVYEAWREGGTRQDGSVLQLPAELKYHWSFDHLPGAVEKDDVMITPTGFTTRGTITDAKAVWVRPQDWQCPWWSNVTVRSTVYTDAAYVPWINNTVSHLPRLDGTTLDSVYWSTNYAGAVSAVDSGYPFFTFPRSAEVYSRWTQVLYDSEATGVKTTPTRWNLVSTNAEQKAAYRFDRRDRNVIGDDLLPMGGAYPKRISSAEGGMWDDQGAADAWAQTGTDWNNGGLPDWWTEIARNNYILDSASAINWETMVDYDGIRMTAWEAYRHDLARGMLPDGEYHPEFTDTRDLDGDRIPDWWEEIYGIDTGSADDQFADADGDGLSNYAEYLISEVFKFARLNPTLAKTDGTCPDYFRRVGDLYLGEIFTDFDQVDDQWERQYAQPDANGVVYANQYVYDPQKDLDNDGWSNYAESKVGTNPTKAISAGTGDGYFIREYPVPTIEATVVYNEADVISAPIVFKAWSKKTDPGMTAVPDAIWSVANVSSNISAATHTRYLGLNPTKKTIYTLGSGMVIPGTVKVYFRDLGYRLVSTLNGYDYLTYHGDAANAAWQVVVSDRYSNGAGLLYATIITSLGSTKETLVGSVDYTTGEMTIDFGSDALTGYAYFATTEVPSDASSLSAIWYDKFDLASSYAYITWADETAGPDASGTYHLSEANGNDSQRGVREGLNRFVAFVDNDGDGEYTPGEPFGFVDNVDVGWDGARFTVELTKTHPVFARIDLLSGDSDRVKNNPVNSGLTTNDLGVVLDASTSKERIRVVRTAVNGYGLNPEDSNFLNIENRVVLDKTFDLNVRHYLHEGDFLSDTELDLDWSNFESEVYNSDALNLYDNSGNWLLDPTNVMYRIVLGDGSISPSETNRLFLVNVSRVFDATTLRTIPTITGCGVEGIYYNARPTFTWTMGGFNSYTAFRLQILAEDGSEVIYDSGIRRAPKTDRNGNYQWTADCSFGDQTALCKILSRRGNYKCRVAMYNAKFRDTKWSDPVNFSAAVNNARAMNDHGYSSIDVVVKYAGPSNVLERVDKLDQTNGIIRVQAFPTADFSGEPLAQTFVTNVLGSSITDMSLTQPNARLTGLPANGTYYIRAYIDSDGDFQHGAWESWGCAADAVVLADTDVTAPVVNVYVEDADTDGDWIPDAYEYAKAGWTGSWESVKDKIQADVTGDEKVLIDIEAFITDRGGLSAGLSGIPMTIFQNGSYAKILLGLTGGNLTAETLVAAVRSQATIDASSVKVTSLTLDPDNNRVVLTVAADVQPSVAGKLVSQVYGISVSSKTVSVRVYEKATLAASDWSLKTTVTGVEVGNGQSVIEVPLDSGLDLTSGFYRVEIVEE